MAFRADLLARDDLAPARELFAAACHASREHDSEARVAFMKYGSHGPAISGCVRDHFPEPVKAELRRLARLVSHYSDSAYASKPARVRRDTLRLLSTAVATRDGSGFYGPQPARGVV